MDTGRFQREHDELRRMMRGFTSRLAQHARFDRALLLRERIAFARLFSGHCTAEQQAIAAAITAPVALADTAQAELRAIRRLYSEHVQRWPAEAIADDWPGYIDAVTPLAMRFLAQMEWEERMLHPLLRTDPSTAAAA